MKQKKNSNANLKAQRGFAPVNGSASREKALIVAIETLALYADPESYHAIAMLCDPPYGWFGDDISKTEHPHYDRKMPGKAARTALKKIQRLVTPNPKLMSHRSRDNGLK